MEMSDYGYAVEIPEGYDEAIIRTRLALKAEGFSILTEAHVGGLLGHGDSDRQYLFMGAWGVAEPDERGPGLRVASHLPCNVVVHETESGAVIAALDPADDVGDAEAAEIVENARIALERALTKASAPL